MFCDKCGAPAQAGQRFCSRCGKEFAGAISFPRRNRVAEHIRLLGILWLALSALNAVGGLILFGLANTVFLHLHELGAPEDVPSGFFSPCSTFRSALRSEFTRSGFCFPQARMRNTRSKCGA